MKRTTWFIALAGLLIAISFVLYLVHLMIFGDMYHISIYLLGDLAFLPVEVLLVVLIIDSALERRERKLLLEKLTMVIDAFFSEVGLEMLRQFIKFDGSASEVREKLKVDKDWSEEDYALAKRALGSHEYKMHCEGHDLDQLREFVASKRGFMLRLLENPNLLEHESFTELLRAVFHLTEELMARKDVRSCSQEDFEHLAGDIKRAYVLLIQQWFDYMLHLKENYPYLYSLAVRTNPFDLSAKAELGK